MIHTNTKQVLFTPGPLTTPERVRRAMLRDWGSRDDSFVALTATLIKGLVQISGATSPYTAVPLQGSGTYAVEAALASFLARGDKLLVLDNGVYGARMAKIASRLGKSVTVQKSSDKEAVDPAKLDTALRDDPEITHVAVVHCETTSGLINPLAEIAACAAAHGTRLIVDAMSSFPILPIDFLTNPPLAVIASSNKCLEGTPGLGFVICNEIELFKASDNSPSLCLDLESQWRALRRNGQWRFTPPVQIVAALVEALHVLDDEGGPEVRRNRYQNNMDTLVAGMTDLGFTPLLPPYLQSPVIASFTAKGVQGFDFDTLYTGLALRGMFVYPGKVMGLESFRIGCIGEIGQDDILNLLAAIRELLAEPHSPKSL